jgi:hypothetical protein
MAKYVLVAMNGATPDGDPEALERWYEEVHMPDLLAVEGVKTARRFKTVRGHVPNNELWSHIAIYEIEVDDLADISEGMKNMRPFHPDFDRSKSGHIFAVQVAGDE